MHTLLGQENGVFDVLPSGGRARGNKVFGGRLDPSLSLHFPHPIRSRSDTVREC